MKNIFIPICSLFFLLGCKGIKKDDVVQNSTRSHQESKRPNIVFILADDLGNSDLGFTGSDLHQTPNLDKLAKESMYFDHGMSAHPTCQPSRIAIQTGKFPAHVGAVSHGDLRQVTGNGNELPKEEVTIGTALNMAGYNTGHIGKWHVGTGENSPENRGYEVDIASNQFCCPPNYFAPFITTAHGDYRDELANIQGLEEYPDGFNLTDALSMEAAKFIKSQNGEKPFFLNLAFYAVHTPIQGKKNLVDKYKKLIKPTSRHRNPTYAAMVETLDDGVGRVLKALKDAGLEDNTIVVFTSDNGGANYMNITDNYPLREGKGSSYEGGYRVPVIVKWPGVTKPNSISHERIIGYDFYPSFLSIAHAEGNKKYNEELDGIDITPVLINPASKLATREFHFLKYLSLIHYKIPIVDRNRCVETVINGDWKLMEFLPMPDNYEGHFELYNLKNDPAETTNLVSIHPEKVEELKASMEEWKVRIDAPRYDMEKFYGENKTND
ncbi:sulfatase [Mariniflexile sp. AS56]|uniref:sulfatase n=1 Tax=Mariniflexile sp. AS56 TaxID=3063957 RepID=UPI0026F0B3C0|nr:sulfatase [Mariniflexile sp. AS56]MDO7172487.1 sulfatase [Mariniflexile sp. AS56]